MPTGISAGNLAILSKQNVSAVTIIDSTGSPKTLPSGQYTVNGIAGSIKFNDVTTGGAYTQPFKLSYTYSAINYAALLMAAAPEVWLRFEGINAADSDKAVIVDLYRVVLSLPRDVPLIEDAISNLQIEAAVLPDELQTAGTLGRWGRIFQQT